ncbi:MAG: hypothetical protein HC795_05360 [Coleofasciculaceae cyanobacterium RL_1_1]|nr:hypothetical protein [Coleofasciculaceae cyanobacterium RL_1_1]
MSDYLFDPAPISADTPDHVVQFVELTRDRNVIDGSAEGLAAGGTVDFRDVFKVGVGQSRAE